MNVHTMLRTTAAAVAIGVIVLASPAGHALAEAKKSAAQQRCEENADVWDAKKKKCATKRCEHDGETFKHGAERVEGPYPKLRTIYTCNGFTGQWEQQLATTPSGPVVPRPTTNTR